MVEYFLYGGTRHDKKIRAGIGSTACLQRQPTSGQAKYSNRNKQPPVEIRQVFALVRCAEKPAYLTGRITPEMVVDIIVPAPKEGKSRYSDTQFSPGATYPAHFLHRQAIVGDVFDHIKSTNEVEGGIVKGQIQYGGLYHLHALLLPHEEAASAIILNRYNFSEMAEPF